MERIQAQTRLVKLAPRSIFHNRNWTSADEMADEVSQHDNYIGGSMAKYASGPRNQNF